MAKYIYFQYFKGVGACSVYAEENVGARTVAVGLKKKQQCLHLSAVNMLTGEEYRVCTL